MLAFGNPTYGLTRTLPPMPHEAAIAKTTEALKTQGFGVLTTIDMTATLKKKIEVDLGRAYTILGACNPPLANAAVTLEAGIGLLLPCNVVVTEDDAGTIVSAVDPSKMFEVVHNPELAAVAEDVRKRLEAALDTLVAAS